MCAVLAPSRRLQLLHFSGYPQRLLLHRNKVCINMKIPYSGKNVNYSCLHRFSDYVVRELKLTSTRGEEKSERKVFHYHYLQWKDFNAPEHAPGMLRLAHFDFRTQYPVQYGHFRATIHNLRNFSDLSNASTRRGRTLPSRSTAPPASAAPAPSSPSTRSSSNSRRRARSTSTRPSASSDATEITWFSLW